MLVRRFRRAERRPKRVVAVLLIVAFSGGLATFGYLVHKERSQRHREFAGQALGAEKSRLVEIWGKPSMTLTIDELERKWGFRAVEERGCRRCAASYYTWWGTFDIATARVVGFDETNRAVVLSWGGT